MGNGDDIDLLIAHGFEDAGGQPRRPPHGAANDGDDHNFAVTRDVINKAPFEFNLKVCAQRVNHCGRRAVRNDKTDALFAAALANHQDVGAYPCHAAKGAGSDARHTDHTTPSDGDQVQILNGGDSFDRTSNGLVRFFDNAGAGMARLKGVEDTHRNALGNRRFDRLGVDNFGAVIGQFGHLFVAQLVEAAGIGDDARISRQDAIDIGPNLNLISIQHCADDGARIVRTAAAQRGRHALDCSADKAGDHWDNPFFDQWQQASATTFLGLIHQRFSAAKDGIGDNNLGSIDIFSGCTAGAQNCGQNWRAQAFTQTTHYIQPAVGQFAQDGNAAAQAVKIV